MSRTLHTLLPALRIAAVLSALGLIAGYVILAQRQANPVASPRPEASSPTSLPKVIASSSKNGSLAGPITQSMKLEVTPVPASVPTVMSGTKGLSPLLVVAPGSKSFVGPTVVGSLLATPAPTTPAVTRPRTLAPSSKVLIFVPARLVDPPGGPIRLDEEVEEEIAVVPPEAVTPRPSTPAPRR